MATDWSKQVLALEAALTSGALEVEQNHRRVRFRSVRELQAALDYARTQAGLSQPPRTTYASFSRD